MNQGSYDLRRDVDRLKNKTDELAKDYYLQINATVIIYKNEEYSPDPVTAIAYESSWDLTDFYDDGILDVWYSRNNEATYTRHAYTTNHTLSISPPYTDITHIRFNLYDSEYTLLDKQTLAVARTKSGQGYDFIYYTTEKESLSSSDYPSGDINKLVGNYNEWLQTPKAIDDTHPNVFMSYRTSDDDGNWGSWSTPVKYNARGERGEDGEGLEMIFCRTEYADGYTLDPSTLPASQTDDYVPTGWSDDQQGVTSQYCFEYVCMRTKEVPSNGKIAQWGQFSPPKLWATYSEDGKDGKGIELIFRRNNDSTTAPTFQGSGDQRQDKKTYTGTVNGKHFYDDDFVPQYWTDDQTGVDENNQCEWVAKRIKKVTNGTASWESFNSPQLWATWSEDGEDSITVMLGNEAQLIPVDGNGSLKSNPLNITIPVYCYKGTSRVAGTISLSGVSNKFSTKTVTQQPTTSNDGSISLACTSVPNQIRGDEPITITVGGNVFTRYFTWSKIGDGTDGNNGGTYDFVYYTTSSSTTPTKPASASATIDPNTGLNAHDGWCARPTPTSSSYPYCYISYIKLVDGVKTGSYSDATLWSKYGVRGTGAVNVSSEPSSYTTTTGGFTPKYRMQLSTAKSQSGLSDIYVGDYLRYSYYVYPIGYIDSTYVYTSERISIRGATGRAVNSVENQYAASSSNSTPPSSGWKTDITQVSLTSTNKYLWNKEVSKDVDNNVISESNPHIIAEYGTNGGISSIVEQYALSTSTTAPSSGWGTSIQQMSSTNKYLWNREYITYINGSTYTTTAQIIGVYGDRGQQGQQGPQGEDGADGEGLEMIFCRTSTPNGYSVDPSTLPAQPDTPDYLPTGWTDDQTGVNENNQYEYVCMRTKTPNSDGEGKWGTFTSPSLWAKYGEQGIPGIDGDNISSSGVMTKVANNNFVDTTVGSMSDSVPSDYVASYVESEVLNKSSSRCVAPSYLTGSGSVRVERQGNIVTVNFSNLTLVGTSTFPIDTSSDGHTNIFSLPSWAKPRDIIYFASILDNSVLSCSTTHIRIRRLSSATNMSGSVTYIVESDVGKQDTSLSFLTSSNISQGATIQAKLQTSSNVAIANVPIYFRINNVVYKRTTGSDGVASLNVNLPDGSYSTTAWFDGGDYDNQVYVGNTGSYKYCDVSRTYRVSKSTNPQISWGSTSELSGDSVQYYAEFKNSINAPNPLRYLTVYLNIGGSGWRSAETDGDGRVYFRLDGYHGSTTVQAKLETGNRIATAVTSSKTYTLS